jgi:hypothetical protein
MLRIFVFCVLSQNYANLKGPPGNPARLDLPKNATIG